MLIGLVVGVAYGTLGAGGSAFATPLLALAGVPPLIAVASPLPATLPAALAGAWSYRRRGNVAGDIARRAIAVGIPAAIAGALLSDVVPGIALLVLSAALLAAMGAQLLRRDATADLRLMPTVVVVGFAAGLLANSGGFLLVPLFVMLGLGMHRAAGTSLTVAAALSVPTLVMHWTLGHIDWSIALAFGLGLLPGTLVGAQLASLVPAHRTQRAFGAVLLAFAAWFVVRQFT